MPSGLVLEAEGRNLDSLIQTDTLQRLKTTLLHEWKIRKAFQPVEKYGIRTTKLALFYGPPGNGKTMAAKMISSVIASPLYRVSCDGLLASYLGQSEQKMRDILDWLSQAGQAVVLFDECESLFRRRGSSDGCSQAIVRVMQVFWQAVDRWEAPQIFILATNRVGDLDDALLSRCETQLEFVAPTRDQAHLVLAYWAEVLHEYGAEAWSPGLSQLIDREIPCSFRSLWQLISNCVRQWIISTS